MSDTSHTCVKCQIYKHGPCFEAFLFQTSVHSHLLFMRRPTDAKYYKPNLAKWNKDFWEQDNWDVLFQVAISAIHTTIVTTGV